MALFGPPNIGKLEDRRDVAGLVKALGYHKNPDIRKAAVRALGAVAHPAAFDPLVALLKDESPAIRGLAIEALGRLGDARAVPILVHRIRKQGADAARPELAALKQIGLPALEPLLALMQKKIEDTKLPSAVMDFAHGIDDPQVISSLLSLFPLKNRALIAPVADGLARLGNTRAAAPLAEILLSGPDEDWAVPVAEALQSLGWRPQNSAEEAALNLARRQWGRLAEIGGPAVDILIPILSRGRGENIFKAVEILGGIGDERAVEPLTALLQHKKSDIAVASALALGAIRSDRAAEPLFQAAVDSPHAEVRTAAEKALIRLGKSAVTALILQLNSGDPEERRLAVRTLGRIGDDRAAPPLAAARDDHALHPDLLFALDGLGWRPSDPAEEIEFCLTVGRFDRLTEIGDPAVEPLISAFDRFPDHHQDINDTLHAITGQAFGTPDQWRVWRDIRKRDSEE